MDLDTTNASLKIDCATIWKLNEQIVLVRYNDGVHLTLEDAVDVRNASLELMEDRKWLAVVDARNMGGTLGKQASDYFATDKKLNSHLMAQALVVNSLALKLIARFYIMISRPIREARIFSEIDEAMEWLETKKHMLGE